MGASASIQGGGVPSDVIELYQDLEQMKEAVALKDVSIIQRESTRLIKSHSKIIETIVKSTKSQLRRYIGPRISAEDIENFVGGSYGKFLALLPLNHLGVCERLIEFATKGIGCDQNALIAALCTLQSSEMKPLSQALERGSGTNLEGLIVGNTKKRSASQHFLSIIIEGSRDDSDKQHVNLVEKHCTTISNATLQSVDDILEIICYHSRSHCHLLHEGCQRLFKRSFEDIIISKLSGSIAKAIIAWSLPKYHAYAYLIKENCKSSTILSYLIASLTKSEFPAVDEAMRQRYDISLRDIINSHTSGKLKSAMIGWIEQTTIDQGLEGETEEFMNSLLRKGMPLEKILNESTYHDKIVGMLMKERQFYLMVGCHSVGHKAVPADSAPSTSPTKASQSSPSKLNVDTNMNINVTDPNARINDRPIESAQSSQEQESHAPPHINATIESPRSRKQRVCMNHEKSHRFEQAKQLQQDTAEEIRIVLQYVGLLYRKFDSQQLGHLPTATFWEFMRSLDLESMGYTSEETQGMQEWCDWSIDGQITFVDAQMEIVDIVMNGLENQDLDIITEIKARMAKIDLSPKQTPRVMKPLLRDTNPAAMDSEQNPSNDANLPPNLYEYIWDTFAAYDIQNRGKLDASEFWQLLTAMNFGFTDSDIAAIQRQWDNNNDGYIIWEEAVNPLLDMIAAMISEDRDHWIGLVDRTNQQLFWYNLRDQSSQWMSEEDQIAYRAGSLSRTHTIDPASIIPNSYREEHVNDIQQTTA